MPDFLPLPVHTFGDTEQEAEANLLECSADDGSLPQVLLKHGFRVVDEPGHNQLSATRLNYHDGALWVPFMFGDQHERHAHP